MKLEKRISIALTAKTYEQLRAMAEKDYRALSNLARHIIVTHLRTKEDSAAQVKNKQKW